MFWIWTEEILFRDVSNQSSFVAGMKREKGLSFQENNRIIESIKCCKTGNWSYVTQHHEPNKKNSSKNYKRTNEDLVKHYGNLPGYLQCGGKSVNTRDKTLNYGVLDWNLLENWKSNTKRVSKFDLQPSNISCSKDLCSDSRNYGSERFSNDATKMLSEDDIGHDNDVSLEHLTNGQDRSKFDLDIGDSSIVKGRSSSFSRRFSLNLEKLTKSFRSKTSLTHKLLNSGLVTFGSSPDLLNYHVKNVNTTNIIRSIPIKRLLDPILNHKKRHSTEKIQQSNRNLVSCNIDKKQNSSNVQAVVQISLKNEIPFFKLMVNNSSNVLTAAVTKFPSGKDDTSLIYTFYSVHENKKSSKSWKNQDSTEKGGTFDYKILGNMKICSSYHAEFNGLERDLFVVRESVLYGPDCMKTGEIGAIIVKNISKENYDYGKLGGAKSTVVILPGGNHSFPNGGKPSSLINRWKTGGVCDCGGWDIGCELGVLINKNEVVENLNSCSSDRLDLCYQGRNNKEHALTLGQLENGVYSLEYNEQISLLQAFSICVAVVSSQSLTHIFQVNHLQDVNDFTKPLKSTHRKVKTQTIVHAKIPPVSRIGRV